MSNVASNMKTSDLIAAMQKIAPPELAEEWDNVGLLLGLRDAALSGPILLTIDLTEAVAAEAVALKCCAVIAYHPPLFEPIKRLTSDTETGRVALTLLRAGICVYSPHTALDAAPSGMTDWLAEGLLGPQDAGGGGDRRALRPHTQLPYTQQLKVVTFVPAKDLETARNAMASAGAGIIGNYTVCSFASEGTGTFLGSDKSSPAVGRAGALETIAEQRLEMVCSTDALALVVQTLRQFHPYEEPPIDVYELRPIPARLSGAGRRITLDHPATLDELATRLKAHLGVTGLKVAPASNNPIQRIGVCPGAGGSLVPLALDAGCELFVTGEMKHHEIRSAIANGLSVMLAGHTQTERPFLKLLAPRLSKSLGGAQVLVSREDKEPWIAR